MSVKILLPQHTSDTAMNVLRGFDEQVMAKDITGTKTQLTIHTSVMDVIIDGDTLNELKRIFTWIR